MRFDELNIGDWFTTGNDKSTWQKIEPTQSNGQTANAKDLQTGDYRFMFASRQCTPAGATQDSFFDHLANELAAERAAFAAQVEEATRWT